ncbi:DMT family transporter [Paraferrimonas sp. SM1919]|uniref:DMT family transporter n=1 Tax=Paraferrimonas sp. SM1919 TaxID=2662263 RepID=UPI0013CF8A4A|nr:DMT family transporter [Paraferrimonas sp. SM1919]
MSPYSSVQLVLLAAIWGSSFMFMKIAALPLGPAFLIEFRVLLAAVLLSGFALYFQHRLPLIQHWQYFTIIGLFNTALPFMLFAYAAQTISAATLSILNSTAPIWAALITRFYFRQRLSTKINIGLLLGLFGVIILAGGDAFALGTTAIPALIAGAAAALCYAIASHYTKTGPKLSAFHNAHGNMWAASLLVLPMLWLMPMREPATETVIWSVIFLGIVCTGFAYLLYFKLVESIGASGALSVTFLIPLFGILWGYLFLGEAITLSTITGAGLVIIGTVLVTGFSLKR